MKKALYLVLALLLLVIGSLVSVTLLVSADEIKQTLISQVKQKTGRDLQIKGAVAWFIYPTLRSIEQVRLLNPSSFPGWSHACGARPDWRGTYAAIFPADPISTN